VRDFGRLALPPLLVIFFASFPARIKWSPWFWLAFAPSFAVAAGRTALATGLLLPVMGDVLLPEALDTATAVLAVLGVLAAAGLSVRAYVSYRGDPLDAVRSNGWRWAPPRGLRRTSCCR